MHALKRRKDPYERELGYTDNIYSNFFEATQLNTYPCFFSPRNYQTCFGAVAKKYSRASSLPPQVHYEKLLGKNWRFGSCRVNSLSTHYKMFFLFLHKIIANSQKHNIFFLCACDAFHKLIFSILWKCKFYQNIS